MVGPSGDLPYTGPKEIHYLFIDGGALRGRLQNLSNKFFRGTTSNVDFHAIARNYTKVFYYDALPVREENETEVGYEARVTAWHDDRLYDEIGQGGDRPRIARN